MSRSNQSNRGSHVRFVLTLWLLVGSGSIPVEFDRKKAMSLKLSGNVRKKKKQSAEFHVYYWYIFP